MRYDLFDRFYPDEPDPAYRRRAAWILAELERALPRGGAVLDAGCGQGFYFPLYAELGLRATGIETDPIPLAAARATAARTGAALVEARLQALPFAEGSFDAVVLSEVLEHLPDAMPGLAEAARVLRPGGLVLVTVPHADYPLAWDPLNWGLEALRLPPVRRGILAGIWANHERLYTPGLLAGQVAAAGFRAGPILHMTRACLPFVHNLVYGLGRALLEGGLLPRGWLGPGLRGAPLSGQPRRKLGLNPVRLITGLIRAVDRRNPDYALSGPSQNLCLAARLPESPASATLPP
jgi:2-polyprenyl-6-hydroxyphenyl methylase/3-demethylubiquinone-9 3-methyltransferase